MLHVKNLIMFIGEGIPLCRHRSTTVSERRMKSSTPLFIFSEDTLKDIPELADSPFFGFDDSSASSVEAPVMPYHRSTPTAPILIRLSPEDNVPLFKRPIQPIANEKKHTIHNPDTFEPVPKPDGFCIQPCEYSELFSTLVNDPKVCLEPLRLGFIPQKYWEDEKIMMRDLIADYFRGMPNVNARFSHKLYNALQIVKNDPFYSLFFGVEWLNDTVLRVNGPLFACILGFDDYKTSIFGKNGQLAIHGFIELDERSALAYCDISELADIDFQQIRILLHSDGIFTAHATENDILNCRWARARRMMK